jgi:hypothetical protein
MTGKIVRIGGASGAWGDSPTAIPQLLRADVDYLMMDYLAEVTMSLLARARMKDPEAGFPPDFVAYLEPSLGEIARRGIRVVSNAGGVNPAACGRALKAACAELGITRRIAVVTGDDVLPLVDTLRAQDVRDAASGPWSMTESSISASPASFAPVMNSVTSRYSRSGVISTIPIGCGTGSPASENSRRT